MKEDESDTVRDRVNLGIDSVRDSAWTVHERKRGVRDSAWTVHEKKRGVRDSAWTVHERKRGLRDRVNLKCAVESIRGPEWCIRNC